MYTEITHIGGVMRFFHDMFSMNLTSPVRCQWLPANHIFFQVANLFLVLTYFVKPSSTAGLIQLRITLTMAGLFFGVWGGTVLCSLDCMIWNFAFATGNALHLVYLMFKMRSIKFHPEHELIFKMIFEPVGVKRFEYKDLALLGKRHYYEDGELYAMQGVTKSNHIGIVATGR